MKHLEKILQQNGYPAHFIRDTNQQKLPTENQEPPVSPMSIPYIARHQTNQPREPLAQGSRNTRMLAAFTALKNLWLQNMPGAMTIKLTGTQCRSWILPQRRWSYW